MAALVDLDQSSKDLCLHLEDLRKQVSAAMCDSTILEAKAQHDAPADEDSDSSSQEEHPDFEELCRDFGRPYWSSVPARGTLYDNAETASTTGDEGKVGALVD